VQTEIIPKKSAHSFLHGGGEMGELTRNYNWSQTSIGGPEQWPQSLRTTLSILLNSRFPMFLWWGEDLIQFYNDAYRPSLGNNGKHPVALGQKGKDCWPEIWAIIKPLIDQVRAGKGATWSEDQLIPIYRNGKIEDVYWTFGYSPVKGENGDVEGVLVVCNETTEKVKGFKNLETANHRFKSLVAQAPIAIAVFRGENFVAEIANDFYLEIVAKTKEEFLGKPLFESLPETKELLEPHAREIVRTGKPFPASEFEIIINRRGKNEICYFNSIWEPLHETDGSINGFMAVAHEITEQVKARKSIEENEHRFRKLIEEAPIPMCLYVGRELKIEIVNDALLATWGRDKSVVGKTLQEAIPELEGQPFLQLLDDVYAKGNSYTARNVETKVIRDGALVTDYFDLWYKAMLDSNGKVYGILASGVNVTEQVVTRKKIEDSEQRLRSFVESAPFPIGVYIGKEMRIQLANQTILDTWGKGNDVIGKLYADILPELDNQHIFEQLDAVYTTGIPFHAKNQQVDLVVNGKLRPYFFNYSFTPLYDTEGKVYGVMNTAADVTDLNIAHKKIEESEQNLRNVILQAPVAMCILRGKEHVVEIANERMFEIWGRRKEEMMNKSIFDGLPEAREQGFDALLNNVYTTGKTFTAYGYPVTLPRNGNVETVYLNFVYEAFREGETISGVMAVATDVTEQVLITKKIETSEARFRLMADAMPQFVWTADAQGNLNYYNQAVYDYSGLSFEELQKDGWLQIVHPDDREENARLWLHSIQTGEDFIFNHRFKNKEGEYRWQLSRAVAERDAEGSIILWIGTSTDIHEYKLFEQELNKQVKQRTLALENNNKELERSNANLQEFAYAASHDLKEPIRKIHFFADRLKQEHATTLNSAGIKTLERLEVASHRMRTLVDDLLEYSQVSRGADLFEEINLNEKLQLVLSDLEMPIQEKEAKIIVSELPVVKAHRRQMQQLFQNIIGNALKYSHPGVTPEIRIVSKIITGYEAGLSLDEDQQNKKFHFIEIKDNGIGFEQNDAERIFQVFTRLHGNSDYKGTGVGLSIARKVVENHKGFIYAKSEAGKGATFFIGLPID
jgi:PAS domain S-box-containing protein